MKNKIWFHTLGLSQGRNCLDETKVISAITLSGSTQCSGKWGRPEAPLRALNWFLLLADNIGKSLPLWASFPPSVMEAVVTFHWDVLVPSNTSTPYWESSNTFCPSPSAPSVLWSSLPCLCPRKLASVDCITWFSYWFASNWVQPMEGTGKTSEGKQGKRLHYSPAHTQLPPCLTALQG